MNFNQNNRFPCGSTFPNEWNNNNWDNNNWQGGDFGGMNKDRDNCFGDFDDRWDRCDCPRWNNNNMCHRNCRCRCPRHCPCKNDCINISVPKCALYFFAGYFMNNHNCR